MLHSFAVASGGGFTAVTGGKTECDIFPNPTGHGNGEPCHRTQGPLKHVQQMEQETGHRNIRASGNLARVGHPACRETIYPARHATARKIL